MKSHGAIQLLLFDYSSGSLSQKDRRLVENHLSRCEQCKMDLEQIGEIRNILETAGTPADTRSDEFWQGFEAAVLQKISHLAPRPSLQLLPISWNRSRIAMDWHRPAIAVFGVALLAALFIILPFEGMPPIPVPNEETQIERSESTRLRLQEYFETSKLLLIGLYNGSGVHPDDIERRISRELVDESRALRLHPLPFHSVQVMEDLEPLLIELTTLQGEKQAPPVGDIRRTIRENNLLFKVRMAEHLTSPVRDEFSISGGSE